MARIEIPEGKGDPEVRMWKLRPEMGIGAGTLSHAVYEQSILPVRERELPRMRIAQINDCAICQQWRKTEGTADMLTEDDFLNVEAWRTYPGYSERERLGIEYAERFALAHRDIDDAFFERLHAVYSDAEILDLTVCIGAWIALGRTLHVLGVDSYCRIPEFGATAGDTDLASADMGDLAIDTAVDGRDGRYTAHLSRDWEIWGPNGGYVAAIALRAAGAHSRFERPASLVGHFLGVGDFDRPLEIETTTLREAKRAQSIRVSMTQQGQPIFDAMVWSVGDVGGLEHDFAPMPDVPEPETIPTTEERMAARGDPGPPFPFWRNFEGRQPNWIDDWENRQPGEPVAGGWYRYLPRSTFDDPWVDACRSVILLDTLGWPAACSYHIQPEYFAPSIDLAVAFHRWRPEEPWLYVDAKAPSGAGGLIGCETRVFAKDGALLGVGASQLLCRPGRPF